jgi:hypothetical protein
LDDSLAGRVTILYLFGAVRGNRENALRESLDIDRKYGYKICSTADKQLCFV